MPAWLDHLLAGPFLPLVLRVAPSSPTKPAKPVIPAETPETVESLESSESPESPESTESTESTEIPEVDFSAQPEKLLLFLESAWGHKHDIITELVASGKWQQAVWIVRALLEPSFEYPSFTTQSVFSGTRYTTLGDTRENPSNRTDENSIPSPGIAGRSGLWAVNDPRVKLDIERRRRGFGIVLGSLAGMILRAGEELSDSGNRLGDKYTDLLPTVRQILAYCHTASLMPEQLYAVDRYPRLHMLRPRILASLADAVWRAREVMVAAEAAELGIIGEHRGMEVPSARHTLTVWGSGTQDIPDPAATGSHTSQAPYTEREVWMELVLAVIVEAGYGNTAVSTIKYMLHLATHSTPHNTWSFTDYSARYPSEYTPENIARQNREPKSGIAERWALEGHSLRPPLVTTHPLTLPDWILPAVADAIVDSTAEGRGLEPMFKSILSYARALPMRKETVLRLLRHPALVWSKNAESMEVGAALLWQFGDRGKAIDMYYTALALHITADNIPGAMRVWNDGIARSRRLCETPNRVAGMYLALLVRRRHLGHAWDLLRHTGGAPPVIPQSAYNVPTLAPALLALAIQTHSNTLYRDVTAAVATARRSGRWVTRATYTSVLNAHLEFGDVAAARQALLDMKDDGVPADGVAVAVLVRHELTRDIHAGYDLVERESGHLFPGNKHPDKDGEQQEQHGLGFSRDAWNVVLDHAVGENSEARAAWALAGAGIGMDTGLGMDTVTFNILLRGVAKRSGARRAMEMCHRYHTRGDQGDGKVVGDALSFRTVLHSAVRELIAMDRRAKVEWEVRKVELRGVMEAAKKEKKEKGAERAEVEAVVQWCWGEMRRSGMQIDDVIDTVRDKLWKRMEEGENWRQKKKAAEMKAEKKARKKGVHKT